MLMFLLLAKAYDMFLSHHMGSQLTCYCVKLPFSIKEPLCSSM